MERNFNKIKSDFLKPTPVIYAAALPNTRYFSALTTIENELIPARDSH